MPQELATGTGTLWDQCPGTAAGAAGDGPWSSQDFQELDQLSVQSPCTKGSGRGAQVAAVCGCGCPHGFPVA